LIVLMIKYNGDAAATKVHYLTKILYRGGRPRPFPRRGREEALPFVLEPL